MEDIERPIDAGQDKTLGDCSSGGQKRTNQTRQVLSDDFATTLDGDKFWRRRDDTTAGHVARRLGLSGRNFTTANFHRRAAGAHGNTRILDNSVERCRNGLERSQQEHCQRQKEHITSSLESRLHPICVIHQLASPCALKILKREAGALWLWQPGFVQLKQSPFADFSQLHGASRKPLHVFQTFLRHDQIMPRIGRAVQRLCDQIFLSVLGRI